MKTAAFMKTAGKYIILPKGIQEKYNADMTLKTTRDGKDIVAKGARADIKHSKRKQTHYCGQPVMDKAQKKVAKAKAQRTWRKGSKSTAAKKQAATDVDFGRKISLMKTSKSELKIAKEILALRAQISALEQ